MTTGPTTLRELRKWIREDVAVNRRRSGALGALSVLVLRLGQYASRGAGPLRPVVGLAYKLLDFFYLRLIIGAELPGSLECGRRLVLPHAGRGVIVNAGAKLGDDVCLMHQVTVGNAFPDRALPVLGDRVFVGAKASVLGGVCVGDGAMVAAHALVVKDIPAGRLAVGIPATAERPAPPRPEGT